VTNSCSVDLSIDPKNSFFQIWKKPNQKIVATPVGIVGVLINGIGDALLSSPYRAAKVVPAMNSEEDSSHGHPLIILRREMVQPIGLGFMGNRSNAENIGTTLPKGFSTETSSVSKDVYLLNVSITVYANSLAECEAISFFVFKYIHSISGNILNGIISNIMDIKSASIQPVEVIDKNKSRYSCMLTTEIQFFDMTISLEKEFLIQRLSLIVEEHASKNEVGIFD